MMELEQKIQQAKKIAVENPQKSKRCHSCKKKKQEVTTLPVVEEVSLLTNEEIEIAYSNVTSYGGIREQDKPNIQFVYQTLFNEPFDFNCSSCVSVQVRKWTNYMKQNKLRM